MYDNEFYDNRTVLILMIIAALVGAALGLLTADWAWFPR